MTLTEEKMNETMPAMMGNQFYGEPTTTPMEIHEECAIMGLIKNQVIVLEEELDAAYNKLGRVSTDEENWSAKYERKQACKVLEAQIAILNKLQSDFENMLSPVMTPN